ncbi:hypothetical protein SCHPADRAFT_314114 [Schizopora paradoxa]|uniref:Uncharacterized protein n=1 Tax=Schizopora paradoxa TaxID=27342 RepID=A0A0H2RRN0_9AGAM|nr:hypothetical protein SCHPADRAFT_314114 [Schizopora paradoxa]
MPPRCTYNEPSNAMDAIFSIVASRYAKRAGLKVASSKSTAKAERRARRKQASGFAPYPAPSLDSAASERRGHLLRDSMTPPPCSDVSSIASSSSPRTPPMGYVEEPLIASRQSSVDCDPLLSMREQVGMVAKGQSGRFNLSGHHQFVPLRMESDIIPSTGLRLYDGADTTSYGKLSMLESTTYPFQDSTSPASDEQVDEVFGMFLNEGYFGDAGTENQ